MLTHVASTAAAIAISIASAQSHPPQLSEVRLDSLEPNKDVEFIELTGVAGTPLDGYAIVVIGDGDDEIGPLALDSGVIESVVALDGSAIQPDRSLLVHASGLLWMTPDVVADLRLEDVDNITVLLVEGAKCWQGQDLDTDDDGALDVTPWSAVVDGIAIACGEPGVVSEWTYAPTLGPSDGFPVFHAARCTDTGEWRAGGVHFQPGVTDSPGSPNPPCEGSLWTGDFDRDGVVGPQDLAYLLSHWDAVGTAADLNADGFVGSADIAVLLSHWGDCNL